MTEENKEQKRLGDVFKKVVSTGITAAFQTEEAIKEMLQDLPLPKDVVNGLLQNAKKTRTDFIASIKNELSGYLAQINVSEEIEKVLDKYDFEVNATVKLKKKTGVTTPAKKSAK